MTDTLTANARCALCSLPLRGPEGSPVCAHAHELAMMCDAVTANEERMLRGHALKHNLSSYVPGDDGFGGEDEPHNNAMAALRELLARERDTYFAAVERMRPALCKGCRDKRKLTRPSYGIGIHEPDGGLCLADLVTQTLLTTDLGGMFDAERKEPNAKT